LGQQWHTIYIYHKRRPNGTKLAPKPTKTPAKAVSYTFTGKGHCTDEDGKLESLGWALCGSGKVGGCNSSEQCEKECSDRGKCGAFSYSSSGHCWLYAKMEKLYAKSSDVRNGYECYMKNVLVHGKYAATGKGQCTDEDGNMKHIGEAVCLQGDAGCNTSYQCKEACEARSDCGALSFYPGSCWLWEKLEKPYVKSNGKVPWYECYVKKTTITTRTTTMTTSGPQADLEGPAASRRRRRRQQDDPDESISTVTTTTTACTSGREEVPFNFATSTVEQNNLGGRGPKLTDKEQLEFGGLAKMRDTKIDLVISATSAYTPKDTSKNGVHGHYGQINVQTGSFVDLDFTLVSSQSGDPVELDSFFFSIFDVDMGKNGEAGEVVSIGGFEQYFVSEETELQISEAGDGRTNFSATTYGVGGDNPKDPLNLTAVQSNRAVTFLFKKTSKFAVTFNVGSANFPHGRHFLFAGRSSVARDSCEPSPTPSRRRSPTRRRRRSQRRRRRRKSDSPARRRRRRRSARRRASPGPSRRRRRRKTGF